MVYTLKFYLKLIISTGLMASYLQETMPIVFLRDLLGIRGNNGLSGAQNILHTVIVSYQGRKAGFVVDQFLQQKEIVEKPLTKPFDSVRAISGVTILGNGQVCLVLNVGVIYNTEFANSLMAKA